MCRLSFIALLSVAGILAAQEPMPAPVAPVPSAAPMPPMPGAKGAPPPMPASTMPPPLPTSTTSQPMPPPMMPGGKSESAAPLNPSALPPAMTPDAPKADKTSALQTASVVADGPVIPKAFPRDRYEASWKKNPFLLKTAPVVQAKESWATDYALISVAKMSGKYRVSIKNKKTGESKRLMQGDEEGEFKIVSVNLKADRKSTSVEVEKGGEKAALTYDPTMTAAQPRGAVPGMPGGARPGMPTIPGMPQGTVPTPTIRTTSTGVTGGGTVVANNAVNRSQGAAAAPSYGGGGGASYSGNAYGGGGFVGGVGGVGGNTGGAAVSPATAGAAAPTSRLGALGPQAGATGNSGLVPMVGGTRVTTTTSGGTTSIDTTVATDPGNIVPATTNAAATNTTNTVTRRRTLIPAPVVSQ